MVIAIIGVLVALLLPAVQAARESSRRMSCANHLRQVGLALQLYEDNHAAIVMGRDTHTQRGVSWAFRLLPYLEQRAIYETFDYRQRADSSANAIAMRNPVATYFCPTRRSPAADRNFDDNDNPSRVRGVAAGGDYAANCGVRWNLTFDAAWNPHISGPIITYSGICLRQVEDGTSRTLAVGERYIPLPPRSVQSGMEHYVIGDCAFFPADNPWTIFAATERGFPTGPRDSDVEKFGSEHGNLAQFVFLDGHVVALDYSISLSVLRALSAVADGKAVSADEL